MNMNLTESFVANFQPNWQIFINAFNNAARKDTKIFFAIYKPEILCCISGTRKNGHMWLKMVKSGLILVKSEDEMSADRP